MIPTEFDVVLSCRNCNNAVLVEDPCASPSTVAAMVHKLVRLVIRHGIKERNGVSSLHLFHFDAAHPPPQWGLEESSTVFRQVICMEDCVAVESRLQIAHEWGLRWVDFEQHFETIAGWSGSKLGECPCRCHDWESGADECVSIDTTLALVAQQSDRCLKGSKFPETEHGTHHPADVPSEVRERARSEEILKTDLYILSWLKQCRRASN